MFFLQAEDGIRDLTVTGVQTCALPISGASFGPPTSAPAAIAHVSHAQVMTRGMTARATDPRGCASTCGPCRIATRNASSAEAYSGPNEVTASAVRGWRSGPRAAATTSATSSQAAPPYTTGSQSA